MTQHVPLCLVGFDIDLFVLNVIASFTTDLILDRVTLEQWIRKHRSKTELTEEDFVSVDFTLPSKSGRFNELASIENLYK